MVRLCDVELHLGLRTGDADLRRFTRPAGRLQVAPGAPAGVERLRRREPEGHVVFRREDARDGIVGAGRVTAGAGTGTAISHAFGDGGELVLQLFLPVEGGGDLWQQRGTGLGLLTAGPLLTGLGERDLLAGAGGKLQRFRQRERTWRRTLLCLRPDGREHQQQKQPRRCRKCVARHIEGRGRTE